MLTEWFTGPVVCSYIADGRLVGQVIQQGSKENPSWGNFDLTATNEAETGPKPIANGYKTAEEAQRAMEEYWKGKGFKSLE